MVGKLYTGAALSLIALLTMATSTYGTPSEPVTVDVYGASYSVKLDPEVTDQVLRTQPWWGNRQLAGELCKALVYQGEEIASVGFNSVEISGEEYIEAYLVMPSATCSGPVVISKQDIGQMAGGTFFVVTGTLCFSNNDNDLNAQVKTSGLQTVQALAGQTMATANCGYFNNTILY